MPIKVLTCNIYIPESQSLYHVQAWTAECGLTINAVSGLTTWRMYQQKFITSQ